MSNPTAAAILYAEDDPDDRLLAEMAHRESGAVNPLVFVADGEEALEYLRRSGRHADRAGAVPAGHHPARPEHARDRRPGNPPDHQGRPRPAAHPGGDPDHVRRKGDIATSYDAGANSYIVKPSAFASLVQLFDRLCGYWFEIGSLAQEVRP